MKQHNFFIILNDAKTDNILMNATDEQRFDKLMKKLSELNAVTNKLQRDDAAVRGPWLYFDALSNDSPAVSRWLNGDVTNVHEVHFWFAVTKIWNKQERF